MSDSEDSIYHEVKWNADTTRKFWDFYGTNSAAEDTYFSKKFARRIVGLARTRAPLSGCTVDMGCGPGFLTEELLAQGLSCIAIDSSPQSLERVRKQLGDHPGFIRAEVGTLDAIPLADAEAGSMFLIEVLEHLAGDARDRVLSEIARVIAPGGHLIVTVPNEEDLDAKKIACPECGCVFHRMQHQQRLDAVLLSSLLDGHGFEPVFVEALNFRHFPDRALGWWIRQALRWIPAIGGAQLPHLIAIARRRES